MSRQAVLGELPVNDNSDQTDKGRRLSFSLATPDKVTAHLKMQDELGGDPIRIPLTRKMQPVRKDAVPEEWTTVLTPVRFCRKLNIDVQPHHPADAKPKKFTRLTNKSWLYIYVNGCLWRELQIERPKGSAHYKDVNLLTYEGQEKQDIRIASGQRVNRVVLPIKLENTEVTVEVAYSDIQWSWARVQSMGGLAPEGVKRKDWFPDEHPVNPKGQALRKDRMQTLPLLKGYANAFSQAVGDVMPMEDCNLYEFKLDYGKKFPFIALNNYLEDARDLAFSYQQSWRDLENYIAEISDANNVEQHPFAPWFDSAVLANQYFFVEHAEFDVENMPSTVNQPDKEKLEKAKKQMQKWRGKLSLEDIQLCLGTKKRAELRAEIETRKNTLAKFLDKSNPDLNYLVATLDDYITLPAVEDKKLEMREVNDDASLVYKVGDELLARLGDHKYSVDLMLETEPPGLQAIRQLKEKDEGRKVLREIANAKSGHPLAERLFPPASSSSGIATASNNLVDGDPTFQAARYANASRRSVQFISGFVQHFYSVASNAINDSTKAGIVGLINASGFGFKLEEVDIKMGDLIDGHLTDTDLTKSDYFILRTEVINIDKSLNRKEAANYDSKGVNIDDKAYAPIKVYNKQGKLIATTSMEAHKNGRSLSSRQWRRERHHTDWREAKVKVTIAQRVKGVAGLAHWAGEKQVWNRGILPLVGFFELYNVHSAFIELNKKREQFGGELAKHQFYSAFVDLASITANFISFRANTKLNNMNLSAGQQSALKNGRRQLVIGGFARGLGAAAGAYSALVTHQEIIADLKQGDDAAIAKSVMEAGFILVTVAEVAGVAMAFGMAEGAMFGLVGFLGGPMVWIGLGILVIGAVLLTWVFTEDTPLEEWLAAGPFTKQTLPKRSYGSAPENQYHVLREGNTEIRISTDNKIIDVVELVGREKVYKDDKGNVFKVEQGKPRKIGYVGGPFNQNDFPEHSPRFARFNPEKDNINSKFHLWKYYPSSSTRALHSAIMSPSAHIKIDGHSKNGERVLPMSSPNEFKVDVEVFVPNFIDNKSLVYINLWSSNYSPAKGKWVWNQITKEIKLITGEGSGPRHVVVSAISPKSHVKAEIHIDLYGNGEIVLPYFENKWTEQMEELRQQHPSKILTDYYDSSMGVSPIIIEARYDVSRDVSPVL